MTTFPFHIYFEILALLTCLLFWKSSRKSTLQWFLPFLAFIVFVEIMGWYLPVFLKRQNAWIFNISIPIEYLFFAFVFYSYYKKRIYRTLALAFMIFYSVYAVWYSVMNDISIFNIYYLLIGSFGMITLSVLYFYDQYSRTDTGNIWSEPMFWIATGVFLFNAGEFSYNFLLKYIAKNRLDPGLVLFKSINNNLVKLFYLLIAVGFICLRITKAYKKA